MAQPGFEVLKGKTLHTLQLIDGDDLHLVCTDGSAYRMRHDQDCCESVDLVDGFEDLQALVGHEILYSRVDTFQDPNNVSADWTFYTIATRDGVAVLRWFGDSDYYDTDISFTETAGATS
jgi:hypothetical protein